jgi:hypothetical protein
MTFLYQRFYKWLHVILEPTVSELVALKNDFVEGRSIEHLTDKFF